MNKEKLTEYVKNRCKHFDKHFGHTDVWKSHISQVKEQGIILAELYGADKEIVEISALLHDIANLEDMPKYAEEHHIVGAQMAEQILQEYGYPQNKIELVKKCILNHRASKPAKKTSPEEVCIADADAAAHIFAVAELMYWRATLGEDIETAVNFVKNKITKSYKKMSSRSQEFYKEQYKTAIQVLEWMS